MRSSKPSRRLASQSLPPLPHCTLPPRRKPFLGSPSRDRKHYLSVFFFHALQPARSAVKNPKVSGLHWFRLARGEKAAPGHPGEGQTDMASGLERGVKACRFSIRALWRRVALYWEPHGSILCHACRSLPALTKLCPYVPTLAG